LRHCLFCPPSTPLSLATLSTSTLSTSTPPTSTPPTEEKENSGLSISVSEAQKPKENKQYKNQFSSLKTCLSHMLKHHGFFIPFVEYLTDLEGFMGYLGAKIGVGRECLWCGKQKESVYAVQQHMIAKSHCKIKLETEEDEEEYFDFYTFPDSEEETKDTEVEEIKSEEKLNETQKTKEKKKPTLEFQKISLQEELRILIRLNKIEKAIAKSEPLPLDEKDGYKESENTQLVLREETGTLVPHRPVLRQLHNINDAGELVLTDGSTIGHRSLWRFYRQHVRPSENRESVLLSSLAQKYQTLQLQNYQKQKRLKSIGAGAAAVARANKEWMKLGTGAGNMNTGKRYRERNTIII